MATDAKMASEVNDAARLSKSGDDKQAALVRCSFCSEIFLHVCFRLFAIVAVHDMYVCASARLSGRTVQALVCAFCIVRRQTKSRSVKSRTGQLADSEFW